MAIRTRSGGSIPLAPHAKVGRPPILTPNEATLKIVLGLGRLQATTRECAAMLGVSEPTYLKFKADNAIVGETYDMGSGKGRVSLRRTQLRLAERYPAMAIFLGKNMLGQVDRQEFSGDPTQPVTFIVQRSDRSKRRTEDAT